MKNVPSPRKPLLPQDLLRDSSAEESRSQECSLSLSPSGAHKASPRTHTDCPFDLWGSQRDHSSELLEGEEQVITAALIVLLEGNISYSSEPHIPSFCFFSFTIMPMNNH